MSPRSICASVSLLCLRWNFQPELSNAACVALFIPASVMPWVAKKNSLVFPGASVSLFGKVRRFLVVTRRLPSLVL